MTDNLQVIQPFSHVTLHYRLAVLDETGAEISSFLSTFAGHPATVAIGQAQLAPFMESRLLGLTEDTEATFDLTADEAFGQYNPELVQWVSRDLLLTSNPQVDGFAKGDFVEFAMPNGTRMSGQMRDWKDDKSAAMIDFNHPLAGQAIRFAVKIIGVL